LAASVKYGVEVVLTAVTQTGGGAIIPHRTVGVGGPLVGQVLMPVLIMIGAGLLVLLAVPVGLLVVSGVYYSRRAALWLIPVIHRYAADLAERAAHLRWRVAHSGLPRTLVATTAGCTLTLPLLSIPMSQVEPGWGSVPPTASASRLATRAGSSRGTPTTTPAAPPLENQVRQAPAVTGDNAVTSQTASTDECAGSCGPSWQEDSHQSTSRGKPKKKKKPED
jgi:hypothetical protein